MRPPASICRRDGASAAAGRFSSLTEGDPEVTEGGLTYFKSRLRVPGASGCDVNQSADGERAWVSCDYVSFQSEAAVTREYERAVAAVRGCLPGAAVKEAVTRDEDSRRFKTSLKQDGMPMEVNIERWSREGARSFHSLSVNVRARRTK